MDDEPKYTPRTFEELLMGRLGKLFDAKEEGNNYLFDEVLDEIEGLFGLAPEIYAVFAVKKDELGKDVDNALRQMKIQMDVLDVDDITKDILRSQKMAIIQWEYRSDMLDEIIKILNEFQMIPYQSQISTASMGYGELTPEDEEPEEEEEEEPVEYEPVPPPQPRPKAKIEQRQPIPRAGTPTPPPQELIDRTDENQSERKRIRFTPNPKKNE